MLELCSALITLANLALGCGIGMRILRTSGREAPELWLGIHFVVCQVFASLFSISLYMGWSDPELALSPSIERGVNALFYLFTILGMTGLLVFARRAFRAGSVWAGRAVWLGVGLMLASTAGVGIGTPEQVD